ncbi:MAG: hypothetical protein HZC41_08040 [Chloroflexi bacterium]|nr:hypothetical protein [Chloroflexota bacterium]
MERASFLIEDTNQRVSCLLNPESLVIRRTAGVRPRRLAGGHLTGSGLSDDPVFYTGGGRTELDLDLLFDIGLAGSSITSEDVRDLTGIFWSLAENTAGTDGYRQPRVVRFVWGKAPTFPGVVVAVAERLERFTVSGAAQRSWLRMRLLRVSEASALQTPVAPEINAEDMSVETLPEDLQVADEDVTLHEYIAGERLDEIAFRYYGNSALWRVIAAFNLIADPNNIPPGQILRIPPLSALGAIA